MTPTLLFIDTNIFLDFYRQTGRESNLSILKRIGQHHDRIITTHQVEMEFKKNRQRVIADSLATIKAPDWSGLNLPAYLANSRQASGLSKGRPRIKQLVETIQKRGRRVFEKPTQNDPVYKVVKSLFTANTPYNLSRLKEKEQKKTLRLAWRRFLLGYPPRKATDTSIGDAVNWEWVLACATQATANVVIVSRDSDYGINLKDSGVYINDWLAQEFKERVNKQRNVTLTDRLSEGLKQMSIRVTRKEAKSEAEFLQRRSRSTFDELAKTLAAAKDYVPPSSMLDELAKTLAAAKDYVPPSFMLDELAKTMAAAKDYVPPSSMLDELAKTLKDRMGE